MRDHLRPQTLPNTMCPWATVDEEREDRQAAAEGHLAVLRTQLPDLIARFARIPDPRRPGSVRHQLTVVLVYGVILFCFEMASRRKANRDLSRPGLWETLRVAFPDLDSIPHADTLARVLERIAPDEIEAALMARMRTLLRRQKLQALMVDKGYVVAFDGTQLWLRTTPFAPQALHAQHGDAVRYSAYVLKAMVVCPEGVTLPLGAEFCENAVIPAGQTMSETVKQDCELKAFWRLCARLKEAFPRLRMMVVADGLYACGPVVKMCKRYGWDFMLVLKDAKLPRVWEEAKELHRLDEQRSTVVRHFRGREQTIWWANGVDHEFQDGTRWRTVAVNVVVCDERWVETGVDSQGQETKEEKTARHAWLSGRSLNAQNVHRRCNLAGRHRWDIEEAISAEKHGEHIVHAYSLDWRAIKGWYYLMLLGSLINTLALYSVHLWRWVTERGVRATVEFLWDTYSGPWLNLDRLRAAVRRPPQLRLII